MHLLYHDLSRKLARRQKEASYVGGLMEGAVQDKKALSFCCNVLSRGGSEKLKHIRRDGEAMHLQYETIYLQAANNSRSQAACCPPLRRVLWLTNIVLYDSCYFS